LVCTRIVRSRIAGADRAPENGPRFNDTNPATDEVLCEVAAADAAVVDEAVAAAHQAQRAWIALPAAERGRVLNRVAALLRERKMELARLEVLDTGKPIQEAPERTSARPRTALSFSPG
jgi:betaine-aldehyde dehydrogenase